ncbi:MAG TPA: efflux RND transporter permease subunit [Kofleriaceae bacterium]|jgi:CzcA family heavy metal efflux pump|nr:efflux RND transporter permease subunit [Kofleriaceae bacterium]
MASPLDTLIGWSIRHRVTLLVVAAMAFAAGLYVTSTASLDVLPDFTPARVVIQTEAPGMGTTDVEDRVTWPLERALLGTPHMTSIRSSSIPGLSAITMMFDDDADLFRTRQLVAERLQLAGAALPDGVEPPQIEPIQPPIGSLLKICFTSPQPRDLARLRTFVDASVRSRLAAIPGVAQVIIHGGIVERLEIQPDPRRMRAHAVSLDDIARAAAGSQTSVAAGTLVAGEMRSDVTTESRLTLASAPDRLASAVIASRRGLPVRIADVADVGPGAEPPVGATVCDGRPGVFVQMMKLPWADTVQTTAEVERAIDELRRDLPAGAELQPPLFRQASFVETSLRSVARAMAIGTLLVMVVLVVLLRSVRLAAVSLTAIPLSIVTAAAVLVARGASINGMVLGGLAIAVGEVVDDAIVDVENVWRRLRLNASLPAPRPALEVVRDASREVRGSVVYATAIVCLVLVPVAALGGVAGRIFSPLAETYLLAIVASLVVALTVTPALCAIALPRIATADARPSRIALAMAARYRRILVRVIEHPRIVVGAALVGALAAVSAVPLIGGSFLPDFHEQSVIVHVNAAPGTSLDETMRLGGRFDALVRPAIARHVSLRGGRAELGEDPYPANRIEIDAVIGSEEIDARVDALRAQLASIPGISFAIEGFLGERVHEILAGEAAPIVVEVIGPELEPLRGIAATLAARISRLPDVRGVTVEAQVDVAELRIRPDPVALAPYGLTAAGVAEQVHTWRLGRRVAEVLEPGGRRIGLVVSGSAALRDRDALLDLPITAPDGRAVPLSAVARLDRVAVPAAVSHVAGARRVAIGVAAPRSAVSQVSAAIEDRALAASLPPGYRIAIGGEAVARSHAARQLLAIGLLIVVGILVLLGSAFGRAGDAAIVLVNFPLGLIGGVAGALLLPDGLSVAGFVGFVTLFGIIARNGIMLVSHIRHLEHEAPDEPPVARVLRAAEERLLPIAMTAATAGLGLLPLAISLGSAGSELEAPMAVIVCGGLVTSTLLNMIVLPTIYVWVARRPARRKENAT